MAEIKVIDPVSVPLSLVEELRQLRASVEGLRAENERLRAENERLKSELDEARRQGKRQAAPFSKGAPKARPRKPGRKPGAAHGRHAHRPAPPPDRIDEALDAPLPDSCPDCGGAVRETSVAAQFQAEIPRRPLIRRFDVHIGRRCGCGKRLQGRHPLQTSGALGACASQLGPDAQAAVVSLNKTFGLSHGKIARLFRDLFGIELTRGASAQVVLRAAGRLEGADEEICERLKESECLTPDETGWRVGGESAWLHVCVGAGVACYSIDTGRSADALECLIGPGWSGKMTRDGYSTYDRFARATQQQCLAHGIRRARELLGRATGGAVRYPRELIELFTQAIHLRNRHWKGEVSAEQLKEARAGFDSRLERLAGAPRAVKEYRTLSKHLMNHREEWFAFLEHPEVEPTNWEAEQAIRPAVVNRKVWGGNRTWAGAHAQEVLMPVLETCKRLGRSGLDFVSETLRSFGNALLPRPLLFQTR